MSSKENAATGQLLALLESRYAIRVLWALRDGHPQTFRLLQDSVGGITPNTLNTRLKELRAAIEQGIARILKAGKAPGILATSEPRARKWLAAGALFVAVGIDTALLASGAQALLGQFKEGTYSPPPATRADMGCWPRRSRRWATCAPQARSAGSPRPSAPRDEVGPQP